MDSHFSRTEPTQSKPQIYLLRLTPQPAENGWRISLQNQAGVPPRVFASLEELYDFLNSMMLPPAAKDELPQPMIE